MTSGAFSRLPQRNLQSHNHLSLQKKNQVYSSRYLKSDLMTVEMTDGEIVGCLSVTGLGR